MTFGEAAARLAGLAGVLGWRPDDFWSATPAELAATLMLGSSEMQFVDCKTVEQLRRRFPDQQG